MKPATVPLTVLISSVDGEDREIPEYATKGSAGLDLRCADPFTVAPNGGTALVRTGLAFAIPEGYEAQIRPRSGLALKYGLTVLNTPGTIDSDYRGEVSVLLINHGSGSFNGQAGDRIAQMVIAPVVQPILQPVADVADLGSTERGQGGFGSTGMSRNETLPKD